MIGRRDEAALEVNSNGHSNVGAQDKGTDQDGLELDVDDEDGEKACTPQSGFEDAVEMVHGGSLKTPVGPWPPPTAPVTFGVLRAEAAVFVPAGSVFEGERR